MPQIAPFRGVRYNSRKVGPLSGVVTQPYDVITPEGQQAYYRKSPWNFVRVVFGKIYSGDRAGRNRYSRAKKTFESWLKSGILQADAAPCVYPYLQEYQLEGKRHIRWGVIALVHLDSPEIYPHEHTRPKPKKDRVEILKSVKACLSPLFGLIPDTDRRYLKAIQAQIRNQRPISKVTLEGVRHTVWQVSDPIWIKKITRMVQGKQMVIADGHHRFEAAKIYRDLQRKRRKGHRPMACDYTMFYLACAGKEDPGLLPTHRLLKNFPKKSVGEQLSQWSVQPAGRGQPSVDRVRKRAASLKRRGKLGIGLVFGNGGQSFFIENNKASAYALDVEWLHEQLLPACYGSKHSGAVRAKAQVESVLEFTQDLAYGYQKLKSGKAEALFVMQPPSLQEVFRRARSAVPMPGKTTFFYPKPLGGLVEYRHADGIL